MSNSNLYRTGSPGTCRGHQPGPRAGEVQNHRWKGRPPTDGVRAFKSWLLKAVELRRARRPGRIAPESIGPLETCRPPPTRCPRRRAVDMTMRERLNEIGITLRSYDNGNRKGICPKCSHTRRNKREPCLSVKIEGESSPLPLLPLRLEGICRSVRPPSWKSGGINVELAVRHGLAFRKAKRFW